MPKKFELWKKKQKKMDQEKTEPVDLNFEERSKKIM
jgi:hypothetical protein